MTKSETMTQDPAWAPDVVKGEMERRCWEALAVKGYRISTPAKEHFQELGSAMKCSPEDAARLELSLIGKGVHPRLLFLDRSSDEEHLRGRIVARIRKLIGEEE